MLVLVVSTFDFFCQLKAAINPLPSERQWVCFYGLCCSVLFRFCFFFLFQLCVLVAMSFYQLAVFHWRSWLKSYFISCSAIIYASIYCQATFLRLTIIIYSFDLWSIWFVLFLFFLKLMKYIVDGALPPYAHTFIIYRTNLVWIGFGGWYVIPYLITTTAELHAYV